LNPCFEISVIAHFPTSPYNCVRGEVRLVCRTSTIVDLSLAKRKKLGPSTKSFGLDPISLQNRKILYFNSGNFYSYYSYYSYFTIPAKTWGSKTRIPNPFLCKGSFKSPNLFLQE
jgi:hypothetical protein